MLPTMPADEVMVDPGLRDSHVRQCESEKNHRGTLDGRAPMPVVEGYCLVSELARGARGVVYRAIDDLLERPVAIKLVHPDLLRDEVAATQFLREARALAALRHEHVVRIYVYGRRQAGAFLAMELVEGESLATVVEDHRREGRCVPIDLALTILRQIADGLDAVHRAGLLHRDVKPDNIVIERGSGRPVLLDFGLAWRAGRMVSPGEVGGTPAYMAPEVFRGVATHRADIYAFACVAYELLCGRPAFEADTLVDLYKSHAHGPLPLLSTHRPELRAADAIIARSLAKKPWDRPDTCGEVARTLQSKLEAVRYSSPASTRTPKRPIDSFLPKAPAPAEPESLALVVDDDPDFAALVARAVTIAFHGTSVRVATAGNGPQALEIAADKTLRLLVLDFNMPRMNGIETLALLRSLPGAASCRVIVVSASRERMLSDRFQLLGVHDFVAKPIQLVEMLHMLEGLRLRDGWRLGTTPVRARR